MLRLIVCVLRNVWSADRNGPQQERNSEPKHGTGVTSTGEYVCEWSS